MIAGRSLTGTSTRRQRTAPPPYGRPPVAGAHVLDPVALPAEHRHEIPLAVPVGHAQREPDQPSRPAPRDLEGHPPPGHQPEPKAAAHSRAKRRAVASARPPAYIARTRSSDNGQLAMVFPPVERRALMRVIIEGSSRVPPTGTPVT